MSQNLEKMDLAHLLGYNSFWIDEQQGSPFLISYQGKPMVSWIQDTVWWHVYPLGFFNAEKSALPGDASPIARLRSFEPWINYICDLGCNGLLLAPLFSSQSHGYDTTDFYNVDSRLGTNGDLVWLIELCHSRNIRVALDGVFNHVGRDFGPFQDVLHHRQSSRYAGWFHINWSATHEQDGFGYADFEGHKRLVKLNHDNPEVADYVSNVMGHWLNHGVDGWRLDAAYSVPAWFWQKTVDNVRHRFPEAWFLGEVIHGDYTNYVRAGHLDSVTQYELWKACWSALNDRNFFELSHALNRNDQFNRDFLPNTFIGNHDVTRIASQLNDQRHIEHSLAFLCTVPGTPSIYYGDEQGFEAHKEKRTGGDDAIRPAFPSTPEQFEHPKWDVYNRYRELLWIRRNNSWIASARTKVLHLSNQSLVYETASGGNRFVVALNISDNDFVVPNSQNMHAVAAGSGQKNGSGWVTSGHSWVVLH